MKFGTTVIPGRLFALARDRLLLGPSCTTAEVRDHLIAQGRAEMLECSDIERNHRIVAQRVFDAARLELLAAGQIKQLKRGVWAAETAGACSADALSGR